MLQILIEKYLIYTYYSTKSPDGPRQFYSFNTLKRKYGVDFTRQSLGVEDYKPSAIRIEGRAELENLIKTRNHIATENIPLQDLSSTKDV